MKVKVIKEFVDKHTNVLHPEGEEFECRKSRYEEIMQSGKYVVPVTVKRQIKPNRKEI